MVLMPSETESKDWKLARPFYGPYRVLKVTPTNVELRLVDQPKGDSIFVALDRVRRCYSEQGDDTWTGHKRKRRRKLKKSVQPDEVETAGVQPTERAPVTRSRSRLQDKQ